MVHTISARVLPRFSRFTLPSLPSVERGTGASHGTSPPRNSSQAAIRSLRGDVSAPVTPPADLRRVDAPWRLFRPARSRDPPQSGGGLQQRRATTMSASPACEGSPRGVLRQWPGGACCEPGRAARGGAAAGIRPRPGRRPPPPATPGRTAAGWQTDLAPPLDSDAARR